MQTPKFTVPGLDEAQAAGIIEALDTRLVSLIDLSLTLKHIHWNVVGPQFIAVHEMLDEHVKGVRDMVDGVAERIATLGGTPVGTPAALVDRRPWNDYSIGKATVLEHLAALDVVYSGIIEDHRAVQGELAEVDPITEDLIIDQLRVLELFQWFVRAHLESSAGELIATAATEAGAAEKADRANR